MPSRRRLTASSVSGRSSVLAAVLTSILFLVGVTPVLAATGTFYFHGTAQDQANKQQVFIDPSNRGTATFDQTPPTGAVPITQTGTFVANPDFIGNPLAIFWRGPFSGTVNGTLELNWFWSTSDPEQISQGGTVEVSVFADPDYGASSRVQPQRLIGRGLVRLTGLGASSVLETSSVPVSGTVVAELLIQVVPRGDGLFVAYDATSTPSNFRFTDVPPPPPPPQAPQGAGLPPRYQNVTPTPNQVAAGMGVGSGEPSIGVNWNSGKVMYEGGIVQTLRVSFDDTCPTTPSSTWEDKSAPTSVTSFDPILFTDSGTGRTFVSQLTLIGSASSFTDTDGDLWIPSQGAGIASGVDHQTIGGGPFHAPIPTGATYPHAVYYCSQDVALANCALSVDGGVTYGPAVPIYTASQCGGLHGHIKVGPDGTAYVPNKGCQTGQGIVVSEDNGSTWNVRVVPGSRPADSDPSVAIDKAGRVYFGFANANNHPVVAVSDDHGRTWTNIFDVGVTFGINNVVFPAMVAGDRGRAAFAFLGTATGPASLQAPTFPGVWHLYIATTYDGGASWITVDATPNDPVQRGCIWLGGGSNICRNLLDFMDATVDKEGRAVVGYADGCTGSCAQAALGATGNGYTALATIARQAGGRRLFGQFDPAEPTIPGAPALTATRNGAVGHLTWSESNDGGSPITNYKVLRGTVSGRETLLANVGTATSFDDFTVDPSVTYFYRVAAVNAFGSSCGSNEVVAVPVGNSCVLPGITVVTDPTGDQVGAPLNAGLDIQSISVAEPFFADGSNKLTFTMKVASLSSVPPDSQWRIFWFYPNAPAGIYYVGMTSDGSSNVTFEYGTARVRVVGLVLGVPQTNKLGAADAGSASADGTITITISNSKVGSPAAGDVLGSIFGRTFTLTGSTTTRSNTAIDQTNPGDPYALVGNASCAPPANVACIEDNDPRIDFEDGWHLLFDPNASGGHFRVHFGSNAEDSARLAFDVPSGLTGAIVYNFARSPKGGTAEIFIDGVSKGILSYQGPNGTTRHPQFGASVRYGNIPAGHHIFEIHPLSRAVYLDSLCVQNGTSNAQPPEHPGETDQRDDTIVAAQALVRTITVGPGAVKLSVAAEATPELPVQLLLIDPFGTILGVADNSTGFASIVTRISASGVYLIKVVNLGVGPVGVWTAATPLVTP